MNRQTSQFYYNLLLFLVVMGFSRLSFGQTNCSQVLVDAQNLYEDGKINEIPDFVDPCLKSGFSKDERIEAYKLLSMVYTFMDEDENADQSVLNLLKLDKEYSINPELDPAEFIEVFNTFRTYPIFRVGLKVGGNTNVFRIFETYETISDPSLNAGTYTSMTGFQGGFSVEIPVKDKIEVVPEVYYILSRGYTWSNNNGITGKPEYTEEQTWILAPVYFRYKYLKWRITPYGDIGGAFGYLLSSKLTDITTQNSSGTIETPKQDFEDSRNAYNFFVTAGLGAKIKIPMFHITLECRYNYQVNRMNVLNSDPTPAENTVGYENDIPLNSFSMDMITFQVGFMYNIYSPKKLEK